MAALTSAQHPGLFMFLWIIGSVAAGESLKANADQEVRAKPGENATLRCHSSTDAAVTKLEWKRLELDDDVFFFKDNKPMESFQDPRYRGRVELIDPEMKNGDLSILLKNVSTYDTGTYKCRVITPSNNRRKRDVGNVREFVRSVHLIVSKGSEKEINDEHHQYGDANDEHHQYGDANDEHHQYGDANDEPPEGPRGYDGLGVVLGLVGLVGVVVVAGLVVKSKRAKEKRPSERVDEKLNP